MKNEKQEVPMISGAQMEYFVTNYIKRYTERNSAIKEGR